MSSVGPRPKKPRPLSPDIVKDPQALLQERGKSHGKWSEDAETAMLLKDLLRSRPGWARLSPSQQNSLDLIATKIARILAGNPSFDDHWRDISGYAMLICNELYQEAQKK